MSNEEYGLKAAMEAAAKADLEQLARAPRPEFSGEFETRMNVLLKKQRRGVRRIVRDAAAYAAVAAVICGLCIGLPRLQRRMEEVRQNGHTISVQTSDVTATFLFEDAEDAPLQLESYHRLQVPAGYEYVGELLELGTRYEDWCSENGSILGFVQGPMRFSFSIDVTGCTARELDIHQPDGKYTTGYWYHRPGYALLIWSGGDRYYRLTLRGPDADTLDLVELTQAIEMESRRMRFKALHSAMP